MLFLIECAGRSETVPASYSAKDLQGAAQNVANERKEPATVKSARGRILYTLNPR